jgi:hypothetical protein
MGVESADNFRIPDVPRERRYNTPQDFAISEDHNVRASYGHTFGNGFRLRNIFGRGIETKRIGMAPDGLAEGRPRSPNACAR